MTLRPRTLVGLLTVCLNLLGPCAATAGNRDDLPEKINAAFVRAIAYLRKTQESDGSWKHPSGRFEDTVGLTGLAVLALQRCGVPYDDPQLMKGAKFVFEGLPKMDRAGKSTFGLTFAILAIDRIYTTAPEHRRRWRPKSRAASPRELIRRATVRLAAAQDPATGAWGEDAPPLSEDEYRRQLRLLRVRQKQPIPLLEAAADAAKPWDNMHTQFAVLALWVGRRAGIPVYYSLALAEQHFRKTQRPDGGWNIGPNLVGRNQATPAMTCAGLLGIALGWSAAHENATTEDAKHKRDDIDEDPIVKAATRQLVTIIRRDYKLGSIPQFNYFLWSLERVAVTYGWDEEIYGKDWYSWGAKILIQTQRSDGSWCNDMESGAVADTAFGLLFLPKVQIVGG